MDGWTATRLAAVQEGRSFSGNERNVTFLNLGAGRFVETSLLTNTNAPGDGRAAAVMDWDDDGRLDLVLRSRTGPRVQVFHNRYPGAGDFVVFELVGNGASSNRDAIGAVVTVTTEDRTVRRTLRAGEGHLAQSSKRLHFGLEDAVTAERVTVRWPDGSESVFEDVPVNARYRIHQEDGAATLERVPRGAVRLHEVRHRPIPRGEGTARRAVLAYELPLAPLPLPAYDHPTRRISDLAGSPVLLNFWERDCSGCIRELGDFRRHHEVIEELGLRIVPMNADQGESEALARAFLRSLDLDSEDAGFLDARLAEALFETIYPHVLGERSHLAVALPTSFLLDARGNLVVIYSGPVSVGQLEEDVRHLMAEEGDMLDRMSRGYRLLHEKRDFAGLASTFAAKGHEGFARFYAEVHEKTRSYYYRDGEKVLFKKP